MLEMIQQLVRLLKYLPDVARHTLKGLVESLGLVFLLHIGHIGHLANIDRSDPPVRMLLVHLRVGLRVTLGRVPNTDELAVGEPVMDLLDAVCLVSLSALGERLQQTTKEHPGVVAQDQGARCGSAHG